MSMIPLTPLDHMGALPAYQAGLDAINIEEMEQALHEKAARTNMDGNSAKPEKTTRHQLPPFATTAAAGGQSESGNRGSGVDEGDERERKMAKALENDDRQVRDSWTQEGLISLPLPSRNNVAGVVCRRVADPEETIATEYFPSTTEFCRLGMASKAYACRCLLFISLFFYSSLRLQITSRTKYLVRCMERNVAPRAHVIIRKTHTTKVSHHRHHPTGYDSTAIQTLGVLLQGAHSP